MTEEQEHYEVPQEHCEAHDYYHPKDTECPLCRLEREGFTVYTITAVDPPSYMVQIA